MTSEHFVGRKEATERLRSLLKGEGPVDGKLTIQSIEGPGGIGKTCLFDHVFDSTDLAHRHYLRLKIDMNDPSARSLVQAVPRMVHSADAEAMRGRTSGYYFPTVDRVSKAIETIRAEAMAEFGKRHTDDPDGPAALSRFLDIVFNAGKRVNDFVPWTQHRVNVKELQRCWPLLAKSIPTMASLRVKAPWFFEKMGLGSTALRNSVKQNVCHPLADAVVSDLSSILCRYRTQDQWRITHGKIKGVERLLFVLDDYEKLQESFGEFLVGHLLPSLRTANFQSVVIILGRDQLEATHPGWDQHLKGIILKRIVLDPLPREEMDQLVEGYGVTNQQEKERAWRDTQGYPFYVQLWIEEAESGGRSAVMLKRFYERTTRWMSDREKEWLECTLFLEEVNIRTLRGMLGSDEDANAAFRWFEREGSVRDPVGSSFRVREYLRSRLIDYLRLSNPDRCEELQRNGLLVTKSPAQH